MDLAVDVLTYSSLDSAIETINSMAHPLALYIFTSDKKAAKKVTSRCGFGGGCINDTIIHLATSEMGFGGFGESGMGTYHGKEGFQTFSHNKSIVDKKTWLDLGFGESGMGTYHGKEGFQTFSHNKSIVDKKTWLDLPMRYQPYKKIHEKLLRIFLK